MFDLKTGRETALFGNNAYHGRPTGIYGGTPEDIQTFEGSNLVLTSSESRSDCRIWTLDGEILQQKLTFTEESYLDFPKLSDDKVVGTCEDGVTTLWDLRTGQRTRRLVPTNVEHYSRNRLLPLPQQRASQHLYVQGNL